MTDSSLDLMIAGTAPDEVSRAAGELISEIVSYYQPLVDQSSSFLVEIPYDPVAFGLNQFNQILSKIRQDANLAQQWLIRATADKRASQARVKRAKTAYDEKLHLTLAHDPEVQATEGGQQAKMALARNKLDREARIVAHAEHIYTLMLGYYEALKLAADGLSDTKRDLMAQLAVVKQQIAIGEVDGHHFPVTRPGNGVVTNRHQELEERIAADLPPEAGYVAL